MSKNMYYDGVRGSFKIKPIQYIESVKLWHGGNTGDCIVAKVMSRNICGHKYGELINVERHRVVYLQSNQKCYTVPLADIIATIEQTI